MSALRSWLMWLSLPVIAALWLLSGSHSMEPDVAPPQDPGAVPRYRLKGVQWTRLDANGQREFSAEADSADYFDDESARYEQLRMDVPRSATEHWRVTSPKGFAPAHERRISMEGPVDVSGAWPDGEAVQMQTPQLWVDPENHQLSTEVGVTFDSASRSGKAKGMKADWTKQTVQLLGDVRMQYVPHKKP